MSIEYNTSILEVKFNSSVVIERIFMIEVRWL